jgi:chromosome partitioning protein
MITIAVANQKGGVGKTTVAFNLSNILVNIHRQRVLAVDNDPQGNLTSSFLEDPSKLDAHALKAYNDETFMPMQISENFYLVGDKAQDIDDPKCS